MRVVRCAAALLLASLVVPSVGQTTVDDVVSKLEAVQRRFALLNLGIIREFGGRYNFNDCRTEVCDLTMCGTEMSDQGQALTPPQQFSFTCEVFPGSSNTAGCANNSAAIDDQPGSCQAGFWSASAASTVFIPPGTPDDIRLSEFVCFSRKWTDRMRTSNLLGLVNSANPNFIERDKHPSNDGVVMGVSAVVHAKTGSFRVWPGIVAKNSPQECAAQSFDPRLKPWFVTAATGVKDIVLVVDRSGSMASPSDPAVAGSPSRLDVTKVAFKKLLTTFTASDNVAVVAFNSTADILGPRRGTVQGTAENLAMLQAQLDPLEAKGGTNYTEALTAAFQALSNPPDNLAGCGRMIIFLTDGLPNDEPEMIKARLAELQAAQGTEVIDKVMLHTVGMATEEGQDILQQLACENRGSWSFVQQGEDPLQKMSSYFDIAAAVARGPSNDNGIRCTNPYWDDFGFGEVITCGMAMYFGVAGELRRQIINQFDYGFRIVDMVHGVDVTRATFGVVDRDVLEAGVRKYNREKSGCERTYPPQECGLQMIRGNQTRSQPYVCPLPNIQPADCPVLQDLGQGLMRGPFTEATDINFIQTRGGTQPDPDSVDPSIIERVPVNEMLCEPMDFETGIPLVIPPGKETRSDCCCYQGTIDGGVPGASTAAGPGAVAGVAIAVMLALASVVA